MPKNSLSRIHIKTIINFLSPRMLYGLFFKELFYLILFNKLMKKKGWHDLKIKAGGFAANGSFLYILLSIYDKINPKKILELGSGQTSKLALRYITENEEAIIKTVEGNEQWYETHKDYFSHKRFDYLYRPLEKMPINNFNCEFYSINSNDISDESNFTLVIADGPYGTKENSRVGIIKFLPNMLKKDDFIIIIDDTHRKGEQDTVKLIEMKFKQNSLDYNKREFFGYKKQTCFFSSNYQNFFDTL